MVPAPALEERALEPVSGGWSGSELADRPETWQVCLPAEDREELLQVTANLMPGGFGIDRFQRRPAVTARTRSLIANLHRRLAGEPGSFQ
ncbi:hypothetical protein [Amycolatopsis taiwanensis]|uniref:hypothetical protein n=1 Tax=Amycolatopsis taiwanensis TaxID=342230 RepID=UPI0004BAF62B|nr:hypothetical protein [Amycolatopsis taiwanensis]